MVFGLPAVVLLCKAFIILSVSVSVAAVIRRAAETGTRRRQTPSSSTGNRYRPYYHSARERVSCLF